MTKPLSNSSAMLEEAKKLYHEWNFDDSRAIFSKLAETARHRQEGFYGLGLIDLQSGKLKAAEKNFKSCLTEDPEHADSMFYLGQVALKQNDYLKALTFFQKALKTQPDHGAAKKLIRSLTHGIYLRASYLYRTGNIEQSEKLFRKVIQSGEYQAAGYYGTGLISYRKNDLSQAKSDFLHCIQLYPRHANAHYYLGKIAQRENRPGDSLPAFANALKINPRHAGALNETKNNNRPNSGGGSGIRPPFDYKRNTGGGSGRGSGVMPRPSFLSNLWKVSLRVIIGLVSYLILYKLFVRPAHYSYSMADPISRRQDVTYIASSGTFIPTVFLLAYLIYLGIYIYRINQNR
jgi:tetratricopeptide (TPR) repeat protein